jgi:multiple sugar transport system permease protein
MAKPRGFKLASIWGFLVVYAVIIIFPIYWIVTISLKNDLEVIKVPPTWVFRPTLENYVAVIGGQKYSRHAVSDFNFPKYFMNSLVVSLGAIGVSIVVGVPAAYSLARFKFRGKQRLALFFLSFRFGPELAVLIPLYLIYRQLRLYDTFVGLMLVYQVVTLPLIVWSMRGYFEEIPVEIEEAARVDGASWWQSFMLIAAPLVRPGLAATAILAFIACWNNFVFGLVLSGNATRPLTVASLGFISYERVLWGQMSAATIISILPQMILALFVQRYIVRGLTYGAVK